MTFCPETRGGLGGGEAPLQRLLKPTFRLLRAVIMKPELFVDTVSGHCYPHVRFGPPMRKLHRILIFSLALAASAFAQGAGVLFPTERLMLQADEESEIQPGTMGKTFRKSVLQTPLS